MKSSKSPEDTKVTPPKKLKQALLPFKVISEVSPKPQTPNRKRKLSTPDIEPAPKVGKTNKENDVEDPVIVIDDDSQDGKVAEKTEKLPNPYVKLVDTAFKKKLQRTKTLKKKKNKQVKENGSVESGSDTGEEKSGACATMEVDEPEYHANDLDGPEDSNKITNQIETENTVIKLSKVSDIIHFDLNKTSDGTKTEASQNLENLGQEANIDCIGLNINSTEINNEHDKESLETTEANNDKGQETEPEAPLTPKRSERTRNKHRENNTNESSSSSKLNDSVTSSPSTPKQKNISTEKPNDSTNPSTPSTNLTPKQLQKKLASAKKREEREKEKQEREKKRQQEKEDKARQRQEKEDQKKKEREEKEEAKRKEKEEKEEQRRKEKEEKEKLRELEKKQKEEKEEQKRKEREEKEEQKRKEKETREEERRKKQEALEFEKQEQELKKKKTAEAFVSFFVPKQKEKDQTVGTVSNDMLTSFTLKSDMRLAPITRKNFSEDKADALVTLIKDQNVEEDGLYLKMLKSGESKPMSSGKTWPPNDKDDDVILVEDELPPIDGAGEILTCEPAAREKLRPKLLSFHENRRPPYWGTWRKRSSCIKPRRPFGQDEKQLDYEVDSDEEWEEEQEGESIDGSAAGSEDELGPDEYEVDNELFVPHGYLSDEEATMDEDDVLSLSPETQKEKLKYLEDEFESEMKKPTEKLKPRLYGLLWENKDGGKPDKCVDAIWDYFGKLRMILNDPTPLLQPSQEPDEPEKKKIKKKKPVNADGENQKGEKKKKSQEKEGKHEAKKIVPEVKKSQPGINMFLTKIKSA